MPDQAIGTRWHNIDYNFYPVTYTGTIGRFTDSAPIARYVAIGMAGLV